MCYNPRMSPRVPRKNLSADGTRRMGDPTPLPGDFEHYALTQGAAVQRRWHETKLELLDWFFIPEKGEKILDVGCGSGVFASRMAELGAEVTAVDSNEKVIDYGRENFERTGLEFRLGLLDELGLADASCDGAVCLEVVEHVFPEQVERLLADLRRIVRPGGRLLMTTPNYRGLWPAVEWATDVFGRRYRRDLALREGRHINLYHRARLRTEVERAGFSKWSGFRHLALSRGSRRRFPTGWRKRLGKMERKWDFPFGNILAVVARESGMSDAPIWAGEIFLKKPAIWGRGVLSMTATAGKSPLFGVFPPAYFSHDNKENQTMQRKTSEGIRFW